MQVMTALARGGRHIAAQQQPAFGGDTVPGYGIVYTLVSIPSLGDWAAAGCTRAHTPHAPTIPKLRPRAACQVVSGRWLWVLSWQRPQWACVQVGAELG